MKKTLPKSSLPFLLPEQIEAQANLDLVEYAKKTGPLSFPLYPDEILDTVWGVKVKYDDQLTDYRGKPALASFIPSQRTVFVNDTLEATAGQGCFTLAHEAGHVSLHNYLAGTTPASSSWCFGNNERDVHAAEWQADTYAACLVMPRDEVFLRVRELLEYDRSVTLNLANHADTLCGYFGVSRQALEIRLDTLGIATSGGYYTKKAARFDDRIFDGMEQERQSWSFQGP